MANAFISWIHKKVQQDVAAPIQRDVVAPVNRDLVQPIVHAPQAFETHVAAPIENAAVQTPVGRGLEDVGLGAARAGVGVLQAGSGLSDIAGHLLTGQGGTNRFSKALTPVAHNIDVTRSSEHLNPGLYYGAQVAANVLPTFLTGGASDAAEAEKTPGAVEDASKISTLKKAQTAMTSSLDETKPVGRIVASTIRSATNPKTLAANAGFQAYSAGQQASEGKKINPVSQAESLGVFQLGIPFAGAAGKELAAPLIKTARGVISKAGEPALAGAEKASGLSRSKIINDNEANTLRDHADRITGSYKPPAKTINQLNMQARNAAHTAGIDITSGSPSAVVDRIYNYLDQRRQFVGAHDQIAQGGYAKLPGGKAEENTLNSAVEHPKSSELPPTPSTEPTSPPPSKEELTQALAPTGSPTGEPQSVKDILQSRQSETSSSLPDNTSTAGGVKPPNGSLEDIAQYDALTKAGKPIPEDLAARVGEGRELQDKGLVHIPGQPSGQLVKQSSVKEATQEARDNGLNIRTKEGKDYIAKRAAELSKADPAVAGANVRQPLTAAEYAKKYDVSMYQATKDLADTAKDMANKHLSAADLATMGPQEKLTTAQRRQLISEKKEQQTVNKPRLNPITHEKYSVKDRARSAIAQAEGINQEAEHRLTRAEQLGDKLSDHDKELLYKYDAGTPVGTLLKEADNPAMFNKAAKLYQDAMDYDLAAKREGGATILRQQNYVPHNYEVSQEWMDAHGIPEDQRIKIGKEVKGFRDTSAKYPSYADAAEKTKGALRPLYKNPIEDLKDYRKAGFNLRRNNLLAAGLGKATPDDIGTLDQVRTAAAEGSKPLTQGAGHLPFSVSEDLQGRLKGYRKIGKPNNIVTKGLSKAAKGVNYGTKRLLFFGTPYHYINEQASFIGKNLLHPRNLARGETRFIRTVTSKGGYQKLLDRARETKLQDGSSLLEGIRKMGVVLPDDSNLNRASSAFSLTEAEAKLKAGLDPNSKEAVDLGQQINHLMGHRNLAVEGESPQVHKALSFGTLAPSWSTTQLGLIKDALTKGNNPAGNYARGAVIGKRVALGATSVAGSIALSRRLPNASQLVNELGFTPKNPVPNIELNTKTKKTGEGQEMVTPADPLGLAYGLVSDPSHYVTSRMSPLLSFLSKVGTNQNWNGQPLAEGPHDANYYRQLVKNAAINSVLPIGAQDFTNFTHSPNNPTIEQGLAEDFGGRLKTNPNDPKYVSTQQYYQALDKAMNSLTPNSPAMGAFLETFGVTKDPVTGNYLMTPNSEMTVAKSSSLNAYPQAAAAANAMAKDLKAKGQKVDPYYLLTPTQQKAYNAYETMAPLSGDRTDWLNKNKSWANNFFNSQQTYFNSLPPGDPNKPQNPIKYPTFSGTTNNDLNQYYGLTNSTTRSTFLNNHPDVVDALNSKFNYDNSVRVARGYAPVKGYPTPSPQLNQYMKTYNASSKADRKGIRNSNPQQYQQMIAFYDAASLYNINKQGAVSELQGEPNYSSTEAKDIASLSGDVYKNADGSYSIDPAAWLTGAPAGSTPAAGGGSSGGSSYSYLTPGYTALHALINTKKPSVVKLKKPSGMSAGTKAAYKPPKVEKITVTPSMITQGKSRNTGRKKAAVA